MACLANVGVNFAGIAMVDVEARAVHNGLCTLRAEALRVDTSANSHQADQLAKLADSTQHPKSVWGGPANGHSQGRIIIKDLLGHGRWVCAG